MADEKPKGVPGVAVKVPTEEEVRKMAKENDVSVETMATYLAFDIVQWEKTKGIIRQFALISILLKKNIITKKELIETIAGMHQVAEATKKEYFELFPWLKKESN